ncbi:MAG: hypothetical protein ABW168_08115 [Sedimenticola sp.]
MTTESAVEEIEIEAEIETTSTSWRKPLDSVNNLWQKHVTSRIATNEEAEEVAPEVIDIPVEELTQGIWNSVKGGANTLGAVGHYSLQGVMYLIADGSTLIKSSVDQVSGLVSTSTPSDEEVVAEGEAAEETIVQVQGDEEEQSEEEELDTDTEVIMEQPESEEEEQGSKVS